MPKALLYRLLQAPRVGPQHPNREPRGVSAQKDLLQQLFKALHEDHAYTGRVMTELCLCIEVSSQETESFAPSDVLTQLPSLLRVLQQDTE